MIVAKKGAAPAKQPSQAPSKAFIKKVLSFFDEFYSNAHCALAFKNSFQLLAATILSAQCTDARVNATTQALFEKYPTPAALAIADLNELEALIRPCGFFHNKALNLRGMSQMLLEKFEGQVPDKLEDLITLPGVGRKTANVVLGNAFGKPGLTVDTHLGRVSRRLGLSSHQDPEKVEADLAEIIPKTKWTFFSHQAIAHGRALCRARNPQCPICPFTACPQIGVA